MILGQHGFHEDVKSLQNAFKGTPKRLQEALCWLHKIPRRPQELLSCARDTTREFPKLFFPMCFSICSTFSGLLGPSLLYMAVKTSSVASKIFLKSLRISLRYPHLRLTKSLQAASKRSFSMVSNPKRGQAPKVVWRWFARVRFLR